MCVFINWWSNFFSPLRQIYIGQISQLPKDSWILKGENWSSSAKLRKIHGGFVRTQSLISGCGSLHLLKPQGFFERFLGLSWMAPEDIYTKQLSLQTISNWPLSPLFIWRRADTVRPTCCTMFYLSIFTVVKYVSSFVGRIGRIPETIPKSPGEYQPKVL